VHTGRGGSGDLSALEREDDYLRSVIGVVRKHHPRKGRALADSTRKAIVAEIEALYPAYDFPLFLKVDALWKRMGDLPANFAGL
jgi:hypothetical protein